MTLTDVSNVELLAICTIVQVSHPELTQSFALGVRLRPVVSDIAAYIEAR